jgi:hypothetical protein
MLKTFYAFNTNLSLIYKMVKKTFYNKDLNIKIFKSVGFAVWLQLISCVMQKVIESLQQQQQQQQQVTVCCLDATKTLNANYLLFS